MPGNSQYTLFSSNLFSYGFEVNYQYKNSQIFRAIINKIDNIIFKQNINESTETNLSYGLGVRVKSILGPIDFLWVKSNDALLKNNKIENYYFSIGIDY